MSLPFFLITAVLIEGLTGIVKTTLTGFGVKLAAWADQAIAMALSMTFTVMGKINFFMVVSEVVCMEFEFPATFGMVLSALILARGSNAVHDLLKTLNPHVDEMRIW